MTLSVGPVPCLGKGRNHPSRPSPLAPVPPPRREYRERDFGIGYGRSSGYASDRHYVNGWAGAVRFRCG